MSNISTTATRTPYAVTNSTTGVSSSTPINTASSTTPVATASTTPNVSTTPPQGANVANTQNTGTVSASTTSAYGSSASNSSSKPVSSTTPCSSNTIFNTTSNSSSEVLNNAQNITKIGSVSGTIKNFQNMEHGDINNYLNYQAELAQKEAEINAMKDEDVFAGMTYEEIIQYRRENAVSDLCKKIYDTYASNIRAFDLNKKQGYYNYVLNYIVINKDEDAINSAGYGGTYFHEVGHLIDDYSDNFGNTSNDKKYDFIGALREDFENFVKKFEEDYSCSREEAYEYISEWLTNDQSMKSALCDAIKGLSGSVIRANYSHDDSYYTDVTIAKETFANFFEAGMHYKTQPTMYIKEVFPTAYEVFKQMLFDSLKSTDSFEKAIDQTIFSPKIIV